MDTCTICKGDLITDAKGDYCPVCGRDPERFYDIPDDEYERRIQEEIDDDTSI